MKNLILIVLVILLAIVPLVIQQDAEFGGADGQAEEAIGEIAPNYEPWFNVLWEPPSGEIESLLFSLQAAIGAIIIGYVIGYGRARKKFSPESSSEVKHASD
ncbi:energy-coupling factor ABC transporter substrate-binding protein [Cytobacillus sp. IB215665]|uniref:energy-coupling factor ABC transporter substrate-binding protein n=1 Tax=Cytobacillus sp. IB215665 TaxID=3097357 RepID=UPI002A0B06E6|nr:energy-coupling factor ABC transporter substrate-binding protein [Cytobacillus sp. IB215665]MDX8367323.1 energy-coupling factor ABC transporter substrate-binding protein [Cytobacillus sp. IB215665]